MASFPTSLPGLTTAYVDNVDDIMAANQNTPNGELNALAAKVGIDSSVVTTSHDYKLQGITGNGILKLNAIQGFLINGKVVPSVTSNNLTVAIKTLSGGNPSATDPVYCRIGDTIRSITAALSVTTNAGTNWFNAGSSELATYEIDYFVYLGYNATDGVVIGFSRIPYPRQYSSFSTTNTDEKFCSISTISTAAATDYYEVIGRFAATLSAGAGYTWTVPTFTATNLVQRPIFVTRKLSWLATLTGFSVNPGTIVSTYVVDDEKVFMRHSAASDGTSNANTFTWTMPFTNSAQTVQYPATARDNGATLAAPCAVSFSASSATATVYKDFSFGGTVWTTSGGKRMFAFMGYINLI